MYVLQNNQIGWGSMIIIEQANCSRVVTDAGAGVIAILKGYIFSFYGISNVCIYIIYLFMR